MHSATIIFMVLGGLYIPLFLLALGTDRAIFWYLLGASIVVQFAVGIYRVFTAEDSSFEIMTMITVALVVIITGAVFGPAYFRDREASRLNTVGNEVPATILGVEDTGNRYNSTPELLYTVEVAPVGAPAYRVNIKTIGYPLPGGTPVTVVVDPKDAQNVAFKQ
jgi:hypothetical protein